MPHGAAPPTPEEIDLSIVEHFCEIDYRVTIALRAVRPCRHSAHSSQPFFEDVKLTRFLCGFGHWTAGSVQTEGMAL